MSNQAEQVLENQLVAQLMRLGYEQMEQMQAWKQGLLQRMFV